MNEGPMLHVYRGTTVGWPGNDCLQELCLTPASRDPLVATLFGIECRRFGNAVLLTARCSDLIGLMSNENVLNELEQELVVSVSPREFARTKVHSQVPIELARLALNELGYELPVLISDKESLNAELRVWRRLRDSEISRFDSIIQQRQSP